MSVGSGTLSFYPSINRSMGWASAPSIPFRTQPLHVSVTISADDRFVLEGVRSTCVRVTRGGEIWSRQPYTNEVMAQPNDGYFRWDGATQGPEWPIGDTVHLELWMETVAGRYVVDLGEMTINGED